MLPPFGTLGNSGRDSLNNPNFVNFDFALFKDTRLTEKVTVQFRAEFFDILNHPNFVVGNAGLLDEAAVRPIQSRPKSAGCHSIRNFPIRLRMCPRARHPPVACSATRRR